MEKPINVLQVNYTDLPGKAFNGYELNTELRKEGFHAMQMVLDRYADKTDPNVLSVKKDMILHELCKWTEDRYSISNVLYPYGKWFMNSECFLKADIVHYHILHRFMFSLFDYPKLMNMENAVWTIHDPWIITGNCVHPIDCEKWKTGCGNCARLQEEGFEMRCDCTAKMWRIKYNVIKQINPYIVVASNFMEKYLRNSPITNHFSKIRKIPFGVDIEKFKLEKRQLVRDQYKISREEIVIGFRAENNPIKGCSYIFEAMKLLQDKEKITIITIGNGEIPEDIKKSYKNRELGWISDDSKLSEYFLVCDIFLMPSLAESFGLMAIEAMAAATSVICFEGTMIEEIIDFSKCGLAVKYMSSEALAEAISFLVNNENVRLKMGKMGRRRVEEHYRFKDYVNGHKELYSEIMENKSSIS